MNLAGVSTIQRIGSVRLQARHFGAPSTISSTHRHGPAGHRRRRVSVPRRYSRQFRHGSALRSAMSPIAGHVVEKPRLLKGVRLAWNRTCWRASASFAGRRCWTHSAAALLVRPRDESRVVATRRVTVATSLGVRGAHGCRPSVPLVAATAVEQAPVRPGPRDSSCRQTSFRRRGESMGRSSWSEPRCGSVGDGTQFGEHFVQVHDSIEYFNRPSH